MQLKYSNYAAFSHVHGVAVNNSGLICEYLANNKGQVFSKEQIYEAVFSIDGDSDNSTISTHIKNVRAKFNKMGVQPIITVWGIGYKWEQR